MLDAARKIDTVGAKGARKEIAMIKVFVPSAILRVIDRAIQAFGGCGVSDVRSPLTDHTGVLRSQRLFCVAGHLPGENVRRYALAATSGRCVCWAWGEMCLLGP